MPSAKQHARQRDRYIARAARRGPLAGWWQRCACACEQRRLEAIAKSYRRGKTPAWVAPAPVREVNRDGR